MKRKGCSGKHARQNLSLPRICGFWAGSLLFDGFGLQDVRFKRSFHLLGDMLIHLALDAVVRLLLLQILDILAKSTMLES